MKKRSLALKIGIPLFIVATVLSIWIYKKSQEEPLLPENSPDFAFDVSGQLDLEKLKSYNLPIIIDFGAEYCPTCRELVPILRQLNAELRGKAIIRHVDTQKSQDIALNYPIVLIPAQVLIDSKGNPYVPDEQDSQDFKLYSKKDSGEHVLTVHEGFMTKEQIINLLTKMGMKREEAYE